MHICVYIGMGEIERERKGESKRARERERERVKASETKKPRPLTYEMRCYKSCGYLIRICATEVGCITRGETRQDGKTIARVHAASRAQEKYRERAHKSKNTRGDGEDKEGKRESARESARTHAVQRRGERQGERGTEREGAREAGQYHHM